MEIKRTAMLAPMAGATDLSFRRLCREFGAAYTVGEMVSAKGLVMGSRRTADLLAVAPDEHPCALQLFGSEPGSMAQAAAEAAARGADVIDINMGCPVPKVAGHGGGSALMRSPEAARAVISAVVSAVELPVTVKFRKGWDDDTVNAPAFAEMAEEAGAAAVCVHGRTREQYYSGDADWEIIREVKASVGIPVIGNGDITTPERAAAMYERTGCDLVAVGRAALGDPWIFRQIDRYFEKGSYDIPSIEERMAVMVRHMEAMAVNKGEKRAMQEARKHCCWYLTGIKGAAALRRQAVALNTLDDLRALAAAALEASSAASD